LGDYSYDAHQCRGHVLVWHENRWRPKLDLLLAILYVALNVVLSITDQFGWIDALILLLNLCLLGLLFVARQRINQNANAASGES